MQGIICGRQDDETYLLGLALNASGLITRHVEVSTSLIETWSDQPADFLLIVLQGSPEEMLLEIQTLRSIVFVPIIMISDLLPEDIQIRYFKAGIDLILSRPYSMRLLPYQVLPLLMRSNSIPMRGLPNLIYPAIRLDTNTRSVIIADSPPVHLTQLEFRLLFTLMVRRGEVLSSEEIVNLVWGYNGEENRELVRGLVQRLRAKIEANPQDPQFIITEPGYGYKFNPHPETE